MALVADPNPIPNPNQRAGCIEVLCGLCDKWRFLPPGYDGHTMSQFEVLEWDLTLTLTLTLTSTR